MIFAIVEKCSRNLNMTCAGSDEEVNAYWKDNRLVFFYNQNYIDYNNFDEPIQSRADWSTSELITNDYHQDVYTIQLVKFVS